MGTSARWRPIRLAEKLIAIRKALKLSQNEMIGRMGLTGQIVQQHISAYESGRREPPLPVLLEYARSAAGSVEGSAYYLEIMIDDALDLPKRLPNNALPIKRKRRRS